MLTTSTTEILSLRLKMVERARNGTSINHQELSDLERRINHSTSTTPVNPITCNTTLLHQDGGKCSSIRADILKTFKTRKLLLFQEERILKLNQFGYGTDTKEEIQLRFGRSFTPIKWEMKLTRRRVQSTPTSASRLTKHSSSDHIFQCKELLNVLVPVILPSRNGIRTEEPKNGDSTQYLRQLETETGLLMYSLWKELTLDAEL
jgi:hypothetical protein